MSKKKRLAIAMGRHVRCPCRVVLTSERSTTHSLYLLTTHTQSEQYQISG